MRILIVDDSRAMQTIVRRCVEKAGYHNLETKLAGDANEALDIIRVWEPHLVLSDWHMPGMTGFELLEEINRQMLPINIGFVTTETSDQRIEQALGAGAKFVVQKPFETEELHEAILPFLPIEPTQDDESNVLDSQDGAKGVSLPSLSSYAEVLNGFSSREILVTPAEPLALKDLYFPCVLGLYSDTKGKVVRAVCIFDFKAASIIGGAILDMEDDDLQKSLTSQSVPNELVEACQQVFKQTSEKMGNASIDQDLILLRTNVVSHTFPSFETLFKKPSSQRIDFEVAVSGYGKGNVTIVAS